MARTFGSLMLVALVTLAFAGEDEDFAAALVRDPERMTLAELRAQGELLASHPSVVFQKRYPGRLALGAADLPRLFAAAAGMEEAPDSAIFSEVHRAMVPEMLPALVRELARAGPIGYGPLLGLLDTSIGCTDRYRGVVLPALLFRVARDRAEGVGQPVPKLSEFKAEIPEKGLPDAFRILAQAAWEAGAERRNLQVWLRRWSFELTPLPEDLDFLLEQVERVDWLADKGAFVRLLGRIDDPRAVAALEKLAGEEAEFAIFAAAELARRGRPERFLGFLRHPGPCDPTEALAFEVLPAVALARWLAAFRAADPDRPPLALDAEARDRMEFLSGVRIPEAILDKLATEVLASEAPLEQIVSFFVWTHPDAFVGEALEAIADRMVGYDDFGGEEWPFTWRQALGYLEVRAPERLPEVLAAWRPRLDDDRFRFLCGGADEYDFFFPGDDSLAARAAQAGASRTIKALLWAAENRRLPGAAREEARALFDAGDPVAAGLRLLDADPNPRAATALRDIDDPRVVPFLARLREERRGRWGSVAALASRGEAEARAEWFGLVRDARMFVLYEFETEAACLWGDPMLVPLWIDRLDAPCCVGNHAIFALKGAFPTLESDDVPWAYPIVRRRISAWFEKHEGSFRESRILEGLVPAR